MRQDIERDLLFLLHDVARLIRVEADKRARVHGMTRAQWGLLLRLSRNPGLTQKEVADLLEVEPISVARMVDRMAANGLIERRPDERDRRVWRLHLMPAATAKLVEIDIQRIALAKLIADGVSPELSENMVAGLLRMKSNLLGTQPDDVSLCAPVSLKENA